MYSDVELESAVASGKLTREAADALREHASALRDTPNADEEQIRLVTSFNDIFVAIAAVLVLVATGYLGATSGVPFFGPALVAVVAWGLAEFFTLKRRMAFPSIVFFLAFAYAVNLAGVSLLGFEDILAGGGFTEAARATLFKSAIAYAVGLGAILLHWRRFHVPISIAAAVGSTAGLLFSLIVAAVPQVGEWMLILVLIMGLGVFAFAMWWDMSDRARNTRRSDVAFWLHLLASPMIVHPIFVLLGLNFFDTRDFDESNATLLALVAIALYVGFGVLALAIDRRAFLVSALVYVLTACIWLFSRSGASFEGGAMAVAGLLIGSGLLMLSALWQRLRATVVGWLPEDWQARLPALYRDHPAAATAG